MLTTCQQNINDMLVVQQRGATDSGIQTSKGTPEALTLTGITCCIHVYHITCPGLIA